MLDFVHTIFYFIIALGVLITIHEFGHFWVARKLGVKVVRFSVGFGKTLWSRQKDADSTEYVIAALPLGGYVKMVDEREGEVAEKDLPYAFNRQTLPVRTAIVLAGPIFNLGLAVLFYWFVFCIGESGIRPVLGKVDTDSFAAQSGFHSGEEIITIDGDETPTWGLAMTRLVTAILDKQTVPILVKSEDGSTLTKVLTVPVEAQDQPELLRERLGFNIWEPNLPPKIDSITKDSPAERAGLQKDDLVISADGSKVDNWKHWVEIIRSKPDTDVTLIIEREGVNFPIVIRPEAIKADDKISGRIGASVKVPPDIYDHLKVEYQLGIVDGFGAAVSKTYDFSILTLKMIGRMIIGRASVENLSGPISIAKYAGQSASIGLMQFVKFLAIVSISLGVLNLLPIPVLDGGHLLYFLIEAIKGSPLSESAQIIGQQLGIAILVSLMGLAVFLDIERLFN